MKDPTRLDVCGAARALATGELTAVALTEAYLARIARLDVWLNCFVAVTEEAARTQAAASDRRRRDGGALGPLDGVPVAFKDNIDVAGVTTTNGLAAGSIPTHDAEVVRRLGSAGVVMLGKLNMHEAALGATNDNPHHGRTHNPWRAGYTPGGSSGGSAAAVAARLCAAALGTDTLGSVRLPSAYCGVFGLLPSAGLVSTRGIVTLSFSLDQVGPLCRSLRDVAVLLRAIAGFDSCDPRSVAVSGRVVPGRVRTASARGLRIATIANLDDIDIEPDVRSSTELALVAFRGLGAEVRAVELPGIDLTRVRRAGLLVVEAEGSVALRETIEERPAIASESLRKMLEYGAAASAARLVAAEQTVRRAGHALRRLLAAVDVVIGPTAPQVAFPFVREAPANQADLTVLANCAGCPALSMPCGLSAEGLPVGLQLIAAAFEERRLLAAAATIARSLPRAAVAPDPPRTEHSL